MAINLGFDDSFKRKALTGLQESLKTEIFSLCIQNGIDPEGLDVSNPDSNPRVAAVTQADTAFYAISRLKQACEGYVIAQEKLDSLGA